MDQWTLALAVLGLLVGVGTTIGTCVWTVATIKGVVRANDSRLSKAEEKLEDHNESIQRIDTRVTVLEDREKGRCGFVAART